MQKLRHFVNNHVLAMACGTLVRHTFSLSSANSLNLDKWKILVFDKELAVFLVWMVLGAIELGGSRTEVSQQT